jgi:hypothetical protein
MPDLERVTGIGPRSVDGDKMQDPTCGVLSRSLLAYTVNAQSLQVEPPLGSEKSHWAMSTLHCSGGFDVDTMKLLQGLPDTHWSPEQAHGYLANVSFEISWDPGKSGQLNEGTVDADTLAL